MSLPDLTLHAWLLLAAGALIVGFAKTAIGNGGSVAVVLFALALPARESTGALLPILLVGDLVAVRTYIRTVHWATVWRLLPAVVPGMLLGVGFLAVADDQVVRIAIGVILLGLTALGLATRRRRRAVASRSAPGLLPTSMAGAGVGFATMTANAAGPVTTVYLLMTGLPMLEMLGTAAWFYFLVNLAKLPFSIGLGLISPGSLVVDLTLVPVVLAGCWLGIVLIRRIDQRQFETIALSVGGLAALLLLL